MEPAAEPRPVKQGRPAVIALIAFVVELVVIAALANQVVTKHLLNYSQNHPYAFPGRLVGALTTYQWRVSSQPGDRANEPLAHACLDLVVLALTVALVLILTRGAVTFFRAFVGTWLAVVVATLVGQIVFGLISPPPYPVTYSHLQGAVFLVPNGFGLVAGLVLGFVTAVFAGIFAVATRRTIRPAVTGPLPSERPSDRPYLADYDNDDDESRRGYLRDSEWSERTTAYPREEYGGYYGGQVGAPPAPPYQSAGGYGSGAGSSGYGNGGYGSRREPQGTERQAEQTQSLRTVAQPAPDEPAASEPEPTQPAPAEPAPSESGQPAERAASQGSTSSAESTQVFPRPPDDEDIGQHPDHHDF